MLNCVNKLGAIRSIRQKSCWIITLCAIGLTATIALASEDPAVSGKVLDVTIRIQPSGHSVLPNMKEISNVSVDLMEKDSNLYGASDAPDGSKAINLKVKQLRGYRLSASATNLFQQAVVKEVNDLGIGGVSILFETPKAGSAGRARINVLAATVSEVNFKPVNKKPETAANTKGSSPAVDVIAEVTYTSDSEGTQTSLDELEAYDDETEAAKRIINSSPIQVGGVEPALLRVAELNDYLSKLNRFPGRQVTTAISAGENPGTLLLDYLVDEQTFNVYAQASNTGTESTSEWIQRFGIFATQLSGNDDILSIEGVTDSFKDTTRSINAYYDSVLGDSPDWRYRITGSWGDYTAADVGFFSQEFTGSTQAAQLDLIWNFHQDGDFFVDLDLGVRYWNTKARSKIWGFTLSDGESDFVTPTFSISAYDLQPESMFQGTIGASYTSADGDESQLNQLGRLNTNEN